MRQFYSASALAFLTFTSSVLCQDCPSGYGRTVKWINCPTTDNPYLQYATLDVPLDYSVPSTGGTLSIPLVRQLARADLTDVLNKTIIYNPGGPGASGIESQVSGAGLAIQEYHVVSFDPRGIGLSKPFDNGVNDYNCPNAPNTFEGIFATDQDVQDAFDSYTAGGNLCAQKDYSLKGELMGTAYVARDIVAIVNALQEDGLIRYYGFSYGTLLGATLSAIIPQKIDRVVLDGNMNPTNYYFGTNQEDLSDTDKAVAKFFIECVAAGKSLCPLAVDGENARQLQDRFDRYLASLYASDKLAWNKARSDMFTVLYNPSDWPAYATNLSNSYAQAKITRRQASAPFDPQSAAAAAKAQPNALNAVACGDWQLPGTSSLDDFKDWLALYNKTSIYAGDSAGSLVNMYTCGRWTVKAKERFPGPFAGIFTRKPILFVQTLYDPITPMASALNSSAGFVGSGILRSSGTGHCSSAHKSTLLDKAIGQYFASGVIPDTSQVFNPDVLAFQVKDPPKTGDAKNPPTKRDWTHRSEFMATNLDISSRIPRNILRRQAQDLPVGCVLVDSTIISFTTVSSTTSVSTTTRQDQTSTSSTVTTTTSDIPSSSTTASSSTSSFVTSFTSTTSSSTSDTADSTVITSNSGTTSSGATLTEAISTESISTGTISTGITSSSSSVSSSITTSSSGPTITETISTVTISTIITNSSSMSSSVTATVSTSTISRSTSSTADFTTITSSSGNTSSGTMSIVTISTETMSAGITSSSISVSSPITTSVSLIVTSIPISTPGPVRTISGLINTVSISPGNTTSIFFTSLIGDPNIRSTSGTSTQSTTSLSTTANTWTSNSSFSTTISTTSQTTFSKPTGLTISSTPGGTSTIQPTTSTSKTSSVVTWSLTSTSSPSRSYTTSVSKSTTSLRSNPNPVNIGSQWLQWSTSTRTTTSVTKDSSWNQWTSRTTSSKSSTSKTTTRTKDPVWGSWYSQTTGTLVTRFSTKVQTITQCSSSVKDCPYESVVTMKVPYTTRINVPTTTVIITSIIDVCPTGLTTKAITVTATCDAGCTKRPTGVPLGYITTTIWCSACAPPSLFVVTSSVTSNKKPAGTGSNSISDSGGSISSGSNNGGSNSNIGNNSGSNSGSSSKGGSSNSGISNNSGSGKNASSNNSGSNSNGGSSNIGSNDSTGSNTGTPSSGGPNTGGSSSGGSNNGSTGNGNSNNSGSSNGTPNIDGSNNADPWSVWPATGTPGVTPPAKPDATQSAKPSVPSTPAPVDRRDTPCKA